MPGRNENQYIHGTSKAEQERLAALNVLTNRPFLGFLDCSAANRILEVGCGLGILADEVAKNYPNADVWGVEYSTEQLASAKNTASNLQLVQGDAHQLPFETNSFDVVYCRYVLEHVEQPREVLKEMHRVLKPGGRIFVQENNILVSVLDPACPCFEEIWKRFTNLQEKLGGDALVGMRLFSMFKQTGFADISLSIAPEVHHFGETSFDLWVENLIGNIEGAKQRFVDFKLASAAEVDAAIFELRTLMKNELASAYFYWNRAAARKMG